MNLKALADVFGTKPVVPNDHIKDVLARLVAARGARLVSEQLVQVFHDNAGDFRAADGVIRPRDEAEKSQRWLRIALALGHVVHNKAMNWPS